MKHIEKIIAIALLLASIGFNLWMYRSEPTALLDPNDNNFQFALVHRTNQMWDFAAKTCGVNAICSLSILSDHWVPNWAQGYNLPYYYSHAPQIAIVASYRILQGFMGTLSLYQYYHWVIYLALCLFPLSVFIALRKVGLSWLSSGFGAVTASLLSTDGLYGLDPASYVWRGYGLSSQLFAAIWLPLAIAYAWKLFQRYDKKTLLLTIATLTLTTASHLGVGIMAFFSVGIIAISRFIETFITNPTQIKEATAHLWQDIKKLSFVYGGVLLLLGYWIFPILKDGNYHNISFWDPIWKFDSFGFRTVLTNLFNGNHFDFGRSVPVLTILAFIGFFVSFLSFRATTRNPSPLHWTPDQVRGDNIPQYFSFGILFVFWILMYFGRTTWGGIFDLIPGMADFHLSRFIVGVHLAGLFLIPLGVEFFTQQTRRLIHWSVGYIVLAVVLVTLVYPQTLSYAKHNDFLIDRANKNYAEVSQDIEQLFSTLSSRIVQNPGRVYFGRGANWGKTFEVAETEYYIYGSNYYPSLLWLPQTWSPNSDTEQYFRDTKPEDFALYNVRYVVAPSDLAKDQILPFWKPVENGKTWQLFEVASQATASGYITGGIRPAVVSASRTNYANPVHLWIMGDFAKQNLYPELTFDTDYPKNSGLPNFKMIDSVTYRVPDNSEHHIFTEVPRYEAPNKSTLVPKVLSQSNDSDMVFRATVEAPNGCTECIAILKQSYHPSWTATVDGKEVKPFTVFPFYTAIKVSEGKHEVVFNYKPSGIKIVLLIVSILTVGSIIFLSRPKGLTKLKI